MSAVSRLHGPPGTSVTGRRATRWLKDTLPGRWVEQAECRNIGSEIFYPPDDVPVTRDFYSTGKKICAGCDVRDECLLYGLDEPYGLWGGYSPPERRAMRDRERWNNEKAATG